MAEAAFLGFTEREMHTKEQNKKKSEEERVEREESLMIIGKRVMEKK